MYYPIPLGCFPEKKQEEEREREREEYLAIGVPEEWVEPLKALGYTTIAKIKELEKPGKLHQEMMGYRKKNKLDIGTVLMEDVINWIA
ncbi:MAG: hypothetical protein KAS71_00695 [Bacteroidales bacterium]|nr:hypothetical protein [Bacteroidales bacterium]